MRVFQNFLADIPPETFSLLAMYGAIAILLGVLIFLRRKKNPDKK